MSKAYDLNFVQSKPRFSRRSSDSLRTESQVQYHFDVEIVQFAKLFVKDGWHVLSLFIPKQIDKLFLGIVFSELYSIFILT